MTQSLRIVGTSFHPVLWDEADEPPLVAEGSQRRLSDERISQVWFAGAHSNVGGGYPDDSLAKVSLNWIQNEAEACGLRFKTDPSAGQSSFKNASIAKDKDGRMYEPREGLGCYYRYAPRLLKQLGEDLLSRKGARMPPKVHESVLQRIHNRARLYAPLGIPASYEVVTESGELLPVGSNSYETEAAARRREHKLHSVLPLITWRKVAHAVTVLTTVLLFAFPLFQQAGKGLTTEEKLVKGLFDKAGEILPDVLSFWISGFQQAPIMALTLFLLLGLSLAGGASLARRILHVADLAWRANPAWTEADDTVLARRDEEPRRLVVWGNGVLERHVMPALFAMFAIYLGLAAVNRVSFTVQDQLGYGCNANSNPKQLSAGDYIRHDGGTAKFCRALGPDPKVLQAKLSDCIARTQQICGADTGSSAKIDACNIEGKDTCAVLADARDRMIDSCRFQPVLDGILAQEKKEQKNYLPRFQPSNFCQGLGVKVEKGKKYLVRLDGTETFNDGGIPAQFGFGALQVDLLNRVSMVLGVPFRRSLTHNWFQVIVRINAEDGYQEFLLPDIESPRYLYSQVIEAKVDGELFIYVNDAVIGLPWLRDHFYKNNAGKATVLVKQIN